MAEPEDGLSSEQLEALNLFLNDVMGEDGLPCPVTGEPVPITEWNAPDQLVTLPGPGGKGGYDAFPLTSPMGGVLLISARKLAEWQEKERDKEKDKEGEAGEDRKAE